MKAFLISLGLVLVTALMFALIGPSFIDWSGYRVAVEAQGERLLGRPLEIAGDLDVRILPRPVLRASAVSLDDGAGSSAASAQSIELNLDLGSLIVGELVVSELTVVEPKLVVSRLMAGIEGLGLRERAPARPGALSRIAVRDATLYFDDPLGEGTLTAEGVDLQILASTLAGPFKINGSYGARGEGVVRPEFSASIGSLGGPGPMRLAGRIGLETGDVSFDGVLDDLASAPRFTGRLRAERIVGEAEDGQAARVTAEATTDLGPGAADFSELRLVAADKAQSLTFTGSGRASWDGPPRFSADFNARQIDLDAVLGASEDDVLIGEIGDIALKLSEIVRDHEVTGRMQVTVDGAIWRGELTRDLSAALEVRPGVIEINSAKGSLPGETEFSLSGQVGLADGATLTGNIVAETLEAGRLVRWMAPESAAGVGEVLAKSRGKFSVRSALTWSEARLALEAIDGIADGSPFSGSVVAELDGERRAVQSDLAFDLIDLDRYLPADARPGDLVAMITGAAGTGWTGTELTLDARAKRVSWLGREATGVEIGIIAGEEGVDVAGFNITSFAGASITADGHMAPSPTGPVGAAQASLKSENLTPLINFLEIETPEILGVRLVPGEADVIVAVESEAGETGPRSMLSARGDLSESSIDVSVTSDAPLATLFDGALDIAGEIQASDALALVGPEGLVPLARPAEAAGAGRLSVKASGRLAEGMHLAVVAEGFGGVLEAEGDMSADGDGEGTATLRADGLGAMAEALGLNVPDEAAGLPAHVPASLVSEDGTLTIQIERGLFAGTAVDGTLKVAGGRPRRVELDVETPLLSLPQVAGALFASGPAASHSVAAEPGVDWPTDLIDATGLEGLDLDARARADWLVLGGGSALRNAEVAVAIAGGEMTVERLQGALGDGTVSVKGTITGADHALQVAGELEAAGVPVSRLVVDGRRRGLNDGLLNFETEFSARGRSLLSLVASLEGSGTFGVEETALPRFDAGALLEPTDIDGTAGVYRATLAAGRRGETPLEPVSGTFEADNGWLKFGPVRLSGDGLKGEATSFVDLAGRRIDQELVLEPRTGEGPRIEIVHSGPFSEVTREVELTNVPGLGILNWREPLDSLALPPPEEEPEPVPVPEGLVLRGAVEGPHADGPPAATGATGESAGGAQESEAEEPELPPVGLIDQQIIDLPILQEDTAAAEKDGSG